MPGTTHDVVVLGGGPAGCSAALSLRRCGVRRVLVADARDEDATRIGESVPPETRMLLQRLGVLAEFMADAHEPCLGNCSSWGADALGYSDYVANPHGTGWHLDRRRFDALLARKAAESGAEVRRGVRFLAGERVGDADFRLQFAAGGATEEIRARFVVDATGSGSRFARLMGARQLLHDHLSCATVFLDVPPDYDSRLTLLEAVEYGYWYVARLPGGRVAVAVASDPELLKERALHTADGWLAGLAATRHVRHAVGGATPRIQDVIVRPARSFVLDRVAEPGWLAVGDAASAFDPLASQGIYKALLDGTEAAEAISSALAGDDSALAGYRSAVAARFADYLANRSYFYSMERRWSAAPFWRSRRERESPRSPRQPATDLHPAP